MKVLALIPARGGSKRVPGKNIRILGDKPLIEWSINTVKGISGVCDVLVSTDDNKIAEVAKKLNVLVPWLRPAELASDTASTIDVCLHALDWYEKEYQNIDGFLLLQPTSPFRSKNSIIKAIELFEQNDRNTIISVSPASTNPMLCFKKDAGAMVPFVDSSGLHMRSQDLPPAFEVNGSIYLITPENLRKYKSVYAEKFRPLIIYSHKEGLDIDTEWDWTIAETIVVSNKDIIINN